jgi:hypothetical protein
MKTINTRESSPLEAAEWCRRRTEEQLVGGSEDLVDERVEGCTVLVDETLAAGP